MRIIVHFSILGLFIALTIGCGRLNNSSTPLWTASEKIMNLEQDIIIMWSVQKKKKGRDWVAATDDAISAADRVFKTIDLIGLTVEEVEQKLRFDLRSADYGYYAPFWPISKGVFPIRIDNGRYGWQFDLHFNPQGRVLKIEKRWIH